MIIKLLWRLYRETLLYFKSKERLVEVCALRHKYTFCNLDLNMSKALPDGPTIQYFSDNHYLPLPTVSIIVLT